MGHLKRPFETVNEPQHLFSSKVGSGLTETPPTDLVGQLKEQS